MLSLNFHKTFIPERGLIAEILEYAAKGKKGKIFIENIIVGKENINLKEQNMVFKFEE